MYQEISKELLAFIECSPSPFHAAAAVKERLIQHGFVEQKEEEHWQLTPGGRYFTTRNDSSVIAFALPEGEWNGFRIAASHSDSPSFKIKENPEMEADGRYIKLNVERYGGMLCAPWFDRPLSVAGRVAVKEGGKITGRLVDVDRDLLLIPNLAIHMNRQANEGMTYNAQKDLLPLYGSAAAKGTFFRIIAEAAGVREEEIIGHDLFLYNRQKGTIWGAKEEFLSSSRLDDLQCAFSTLKGFLAGEKRRYAAVFCMLDNEEVGSGTRQGAASPFLKDVLMRISLSLGGGWEDYLRRVAKSFLVSADNAHAVHPNYGEKSDPVNHPYLNGGIVLKYSANQKYCTDGLSAAVWKEICREAGAPLQVFTNRSDMPGGSTLGNISMSQVAVSAVDIGLPQLAMHSPYETAGVKDTVYLMQAAKEYFK
ncbi:M18 family aminopeptidase [Hominifimenecus sp. rT4P-3]|uniref:M18 family aminopeptidase n=1 Tax=Hominifimenecus sp. rT4P-3 TaxID=3242979 RepID=UPI003DA3905D